MEIQTLKQDLINDSFDSFSTIHAILSHYKITPKDILLLKTKYTKQYNQLKSLLTQKIADLYELAVNRPRQIQSMIKLIEAQEAHFNRLFPDENINNIKMPTIVITPTTSKSSTRLSIPTIIAQKD